MTDLKSPNKIFALAARELFSAHQRRRDSKIASIVDDFDLLKLDRRDAVDMSKDEPSQNKTEHAARRKTLIEKFGASLGLVDIG
jgi:hypothetical protein